MAACKRLHTAGICVDSRSTYGANHARERACAVFDYGAHPRREQGAQAAQVSRPLALIPVRATQQIPCQQTPDKIDDCITRPLHGHCSSETVRAISHHNAEKNQSQY